MGGEKGEHEEREHSPQAKAVKLEVYAWGKKASQDPIYAEVNSLVNDAGWHRKDTADKIAGDRVTAIISVPNNWGGSFSGHPGHCGVALWNHATKDYQSAGICSNGEFAPEEVNVKNDTIKVDKNFTIWYFTVAIKPDAYEKMRAKMDKLGSKKHGYGKLLVWRGWSSEGSFSCVTAIDAVLHAGGLSKMVAAQTSAPYAYAQTFTSAAGWYCSKAVGYKHM